jgi:hypothetical protein
MTTEAMHSRWTALAVVAAAALWPTAGAAGPIGVNLFYVSDYEPQHFFADIIRQARPWGRIGSVQEPVPVDAEGWPTGDAGLIVLTGLGGKPQAGAAGTYKLSFLGEATVEAEHGPHGSVVVRNEKYDRKTHTTTADVEVGPAAVILTLNFRGQAGGVKQVRMMRPGHGPNELFSRDLLERVRSFPAIRYMDVLGPRSKGLNANLDARWSDRTRPGQVPQSRADHGTALEWVILFANAAGKDAWVNIPFHADDDYITRFAQVLRYGSDGTNPYTSPQANPVYPPLRPDLKLYVEFGNELWNSGFRDTEENFNASTVAWTRNTKYEAGPRGGRRVKVGEGADARVYVARKGGTSAFLGSGPTGTGTGIEDGSVTWDYAGRLGDLPSGEGAAFLDWDGRTNHYQVGFRRVGWLAVRTSNLFRAVFGDEAMMTRVRPVLATQVVRHDTSTLPLDYIREVWGGRTGERNAYGKMAHPVSHYLYALAVAPYVHVPRGDRYGSADEVLDAMVATLQKTEPNALLPSIDFQARTARTHGLKLVAYEGGQHVVGEDGSGAAKLAAQSSPRMRDEVLLPLFRHWDRAGGDLFLYYALCAGNSDYGYWGLSDDIRSEAGPKWDAVKAMAAGGGR